MDRWTPHSQLDQTELLRAARARDLQATSLEDLRKMAADLTIACEAARVAAIRNILQATPGPSPEYADEAQCGFTSLYTALRRVRAELKRKESPSPRRTTSPSGRSDALQRLRPKARNHSEVSTPKHS